MPSLKAEGSAGSVRLLSPSPSEVLYGPVTIRAEAVAFGGRSVLKVRFFADGRLLGEEIHPPFELRWDAGDSLASRVIRVEAILDDGSSAATLIATRGLKLREEELVEATPIEHVELLVSVTDAAGEPVPGLGLEEFEVREEGNLVRLLRADDLAGRVDLPLSIALLIDRSGSMRVHMEKIARAATDLLSVMRPVDHVRVAAFSDQMVVLQDFTQEPLALIASLNGVGPPVGGTRLFRAVADTVRDMRDRLGRKVLIVLTDGLDTDFTSPSSPVTVNMYGILQEVARMASRAGVTVIMILPGPSGRGYLAAQDLALQTGGWYAYPGDDLAGTIRRMGERLLGGYVLEYDAERPEKLDRKRPLEVSVIDGRSRGWSVTASMGTYAKLDLAEALFRDLEDGTTVQRARAAREIGLFPGEEAVDLLAGALRDREPEVRAAAVTALSERRAGGVMDDVLGRIRDTDAGVRRAAIEAAVRYGPPAVPWLMERAARRGEEREAALEALGSIGGEAAAGALGEAMEHGNCAVRAAAATGTGRLLAGMGPAAIDDAAAARLRGRLRARLKELLDDGCGRASAAARGALGRLGPERPGRLSPPESSRGS
jgi:VWFA-related protein